MRRGINFGYWTFFTKVKRCRTLGFSLAVGKFCAYRSSMSTRFRSARSRSRALLRHRAEFSVSQCVPVPKTGHNPIPPIERAYVDRRSAAALLSVSVSLFDKRVRARTYPQPVPGQPPRWAVAELLDYRGWGVGQIPCEAPGEDDDGAEFPEPEL